MQVNVTRNDRLLVVGYDREGGRRQLEFMGIAFAYWRQETKFPHAGHVLLSTWASLFHMIMALGIEFDLLTTMGIAFFLFLAVWVPCCTSDIVFPLLFTERGK